MSIIVLPDEHPGRCLNHRRVMGRSGHSVMLRCLDYEAVEHVCVFPPADPDYVDLDMVSSFTQTTEPRPWVRPDGVTP